MKNNRKVILYIAESLDGFIAREDGDIEWLSMVEEPNEDYGYRHFLESTDTVIMGRKTYEKVLSFGIEFPYKGKKCYVLSKTMSSRDDNIEYFNGGIKELIEALKSKSNSGKHIFVDGGSEVVREFASANLIDEYIVSIIPILLGRGIRLFRETDVENKLKLIGSAVFPSGLVQLRYERVK